MMPTCRVSIHCIAWLLSLGALAQSDVRFQHLSIQEGLSQSTVFTVLQDRAGFMWFGTNDGLNRYDGYQFIHFKHRSDNSASLSDSWISVLFEDSAATLWVGTFNYGLNRRLPDGGFERIDLGLSQTDLGLGQNLVTAITEPMPGVLWVGLQSHGIAVYREHQPISYHQAQGQEGSLHSNNLRALFTDRDGTVWVGSDSGLERFTRDRQQFERVIDVADDGSQPLRINCLSSGSDGSLWIGTESQGLYQRYPNGRIEHHGGADFEASPIRALIEDKDGVIWFGSATHGLTRFNPSTRRLAQFRANYSDIDSLRDDALYSLCQDRSGLIWVGTYAEGLSRFNPELQGFRHVRAFPEKSNSLSGNVVTSFAWDRGKLWVGTRHSGLNLYDPATNSYSHYRHQPKDLNSLSSDEVRHVMRDGRGAIWVSTENGLNQITAKGKIHRFLPDGKPGSLNAHTVMQTVEDGNKLLLATYEGGLNIFDPLTETFSACTYQADNPHSISSNYVNHIFKGYDDRLWIGTENGLCMFELERRSFTRYAPVTQPYQEGLRHPSVMVSFQRPGEDQLWLGTYGGGLHQFDPNTGTFRVYTTQDGLANDAIYGIADDALGRLWISTNGGISRFHPETGEFRTYDNNNGLPRNEFNRGAVFRAPDDKLYFGGYGYVVFDPLKIRGNTYIPPVVLTNVIVGNQPLKHDRPLRELKELRLAYNHHVLALSFAALDFNSPARNRFAYRLEGVFDDWVVLEGRHDVTYTALAPGNYSLNIKGSNNDGVWNEEGLILPIIVTSPPWRTYQAYLIYTLVVLALAIAIWRMRLRAQNQELERAMSLGKAEFATTVLHNIGNVLNSVRVSCDKTASTMRGSKVKPLLRALDLLDEHIDDLDNYLKNDARGKLLPGYFKSAAEIVAEEYREMLAECDEMSERIGLMKGIIETQQAHASISLADESHNLNEVVRDALRVQDNGLRQRSIQVEEHLRPLPPVNVPKTQLMHVIINLIKNAREAMDHNGEREKRLLLESGRYGDAEVFLKITDTGVGISREHLTKMFTYGFTTKPNGHGFGLNYCNRAMREMGGSIEVESEGPGKGASFTLLFRSNNNG